MRLFDFNLKFIQVLAIQPICDVGIFVDVFAGILFTVGFVCEYALCVFVRL